MTPDTQAPGPTPGALVEVRPLAQALRAFAQARDWEQFHSPKNLVMALAGEAGELTAVFQWMTEDASREAARDTRTAAAVRHELADVLLYLVRLADVLGVDLDAAAREKLKVNEARYPAEQARGTSAKYTDFNNNSRE